MIKFQWSKPGEFEYGHHMFNNFLWTLWISWCPQIDSTAPLKRQERGAGATLWCRSYYLWWSQQQTMQPLSPTSVFGYFFIIKQIKFILTLHHYWCCCAVDSESAMRPFALTHIPALPSDRPVPVVQPGVGGSSPYFRWRTEPSSPSSPWPPSRTVWSPSAEFSSSSPARGRGDCDGWFYSTDCRWFSALRWFRSFIDLLSCTCRRTLVSSNCVQLYFIFFRRELDCFFCYFFAAISGFPPARQFVGHPALGVLALFFFIFKACNRTKTKRTHKQTLPPWTF